MTELSSDHALLASTLALLDQGRYVNQLSCWLSVAGVAALLARSFNSAPPTAPISFVALSVLAGLAELCLAVRLDFDSRLFSHLLDDANSGEP